MAAQGRRLGDPSYGGPGFDLVERTLRTIERDSMLEGGENVVVAYSGGPDSTCLLDVLARISGKLGLSLIVAHVDHGLSEGSETVSARASAAAAEAGFEVHMTRAPDLSGSNLQARARAFRYGFLDIVARRENADRIATGHTLDDRAETTLARLIHGAGTSGLAGLPPVEGDRIRPLIDSRRKQSRAYCLECGIEFHDDPANRDERFERVAIRDRLVEAIEEHWGEGAVRSVAASADRLRDDAAALDSIADRLYRDSVRATDRGTEFDRRAMLEIPRALQRRLLERAVGRVRDRSGGIEAALAAIDAGGKGSDLRFSVASGVEIEITADNVLVRRSG